MLRQFAALPILIFGNVYLRFVDFHKHLGVTFSSRGQWHNHVEIYSRLSLSRNPRDSMKHFEISELRYIRFAELRKTINPTTNFNKMNI